MAKIYPETEVARLEGRDEGDRTWLYVICSDGRVLFQRAFVGGDSFAFRGVVQDEEKRTVEYLAELMEYDHLEVINGQPGV